MSAMKYVVALAILCVPAMLAAKGACVMAEARDEPSAVLSLAVGWQISPLFAERVL